MKKLHLFRKTASWIIVLSLLFSSCVTTRFIRDEESLKLEKSIKGKRALNIFGDSFMTAGSVVLAIFTGIYVGYVPGSRNLKKISLINESSDTLQINMLTDQIWKDSLYCDFRDIRIPPGNKCRLLVPVNTMYNLYFSNTIGSGSDDELLEINTSQQSKIRLSPGMTMIDNE